jgi:hypothetical protein
VLKTTVVFSNQPLAYREVIASAVQSLRPWLDVIMRTPQELDAEIAELRPGLVVCNAVSDAIRAHARAWILLYPEGASSVTCCIAGHERQLPGVDLSGLLALVDEAIVHPLASTIADEFGAQPL